MSCLDDSTASEPNCEPPENCPQLNGSQGPLTQGVARPTPLQKPAASDQLTRGCKGLAPLLPGGIGSVVQATPQGYPRDQAASGST